MATKSRKKKPACVSCSSFFESKDGSLKLYPEIVTQNSGSKSPFPYTISKRAYSSVTMWCAGSKSMSCSILWPRNLLYETLTKPERPHNYFSRAI